MATKKKLLTYAGLQRFVSKLPTPSAPTENHYRVELTSGQTYTFTIPNYSSTNSLVEVYLNGLRLIPTTEYTLSSAGLITLTAQMSTTGNVLHVVHRKGS